MHKSRIEFNTKTAERKAHGRINRSFVHSYSRQAGVKMLNSANLIIGIIEWFKLSAEIEVNLNRQRFSKKVVFYKFFECWGIDLRRWMRSETSEFDRYSPTWIEANKVRVHFNWFYNNLCIFSGISVQNCCV